MKSHDSSRDYARIERAIAFLHERWIEQPALREVAREVGLSESHFDRMFRRWAGVSATQFLRFLTKESAKARLRAGASVLEASYAVGLSGPGRLHDLLVTCEAVTPGEFKSGGRDVEIRYGFAATAFGECLLAATDRGLCALAFRSEGEDLLDELRREWPHARFRESAIEAGSLAAAVFEPRRAALSLHLRGTNFQLKVWQALLRIPEGALATYQDIARAIGQPAAARAVGSAVGANSLSVLVPCHRVIRKSGLFGHYRWGSARKLALCGREAARTEAFP